MEPEFLDAAKFLANLPKSNLDDRTFDELVEECLLRIPRYCPEWTNYNPGDPGVTLIELFAWLVDQMLYRFNQVPRRHYVALLELLGIRLEPPKPAQTSLTFYLTKSQLEPKQIEAGTEVATIRTENQEAVIFTTDHDLTVGQPYIKHVLLAANTINHPTKDTLDASPENTLQGQKQYIDPEEKRQKWHDLTRPLSLFKSCQPNNCFYMVFEPVGQGRSNVYTTRAQGTAQTIQTTQNQDSIAGNVLAITFRGPEAVTTGINTENPPLRWQAWNGKAWEDGILRRSQDDQTKGFSFDKLGQEAPNPVSEGVDVILHLPQHWPATSFDDGEGDQENIYHGHWIRCVYEIDQTLDQYGYERSPEILGLNVRAIGGTVSASECVQVSEEFLGISNGKPGQTFNLDNRPILTRTAEEHIRVVLPDGNVEHWDEVPDLANSDKDSRHYLLDSLGGRIQFGPLIREPSQISNQTRERSRLQSWGRTSESRIRSVAFSSNTSLMDDPALPATLDAEDHSLERQYGKVPPLGAEIYMTGYRVGGGSQGNVQAKKLTVMKTSIPYVKRVTNYPKATGGLDAESLDDAVMRVPALLRTRKTAVTPEDFEHLARQLTLTRPVHRAHAVTKPELTTPGVVRLLVIPTPSSTLEYPDFSHGIHPHEFSLDEKFKDELNQKINLHKALGIRVETESPQFVGIRITAQILLEPQYRNANSEAALESTFIIKKRLLTDLYKFLNPLTGGLKIGGLNPREQLRNSHGTFANLGWPLGRAIKTADIIALLQNVPEVSYVSQVELTCFRQYGEDVNWISLPAANGLIRLNELEVACSWDEEYFRSHNLVEVDINSPKLVTAHHIEFMTE